MDKPQSGPLFLDTSIHIARLVHSRGTKDRIRARLEQHERIETGLVARQEFKRRLLSEARYILSLLDEHDSFDEVQHRVIRLPSMPGLNRKKNICLQTLAQIHGGTDVDRTDRLRLYLRSLLLVGLRRFDQSVDLVRTESGCGCATVDVVETGRRQLYDVGPTRCSKLKEGKCDVVAFLAARREQCERLLPFLRGLAPDQKTAELLKSEVFLEKVLNNPSAAVREDPCLTVGDLLIALESARTIAFYTLNRAESLQFCRALGQTLIVRPIDPREVDVVHEPPNHPPPVSPTQPDDQSDEPPA